MTAIPAPQDCLPAQGDQKKHHELWNILHLNRTRSPGVKLSKSLRHCCYSPAWLELEGNLLETSGNQLYSKNLHMFLQKKKHILKTPFERQLSRKSAWNINVRSSKITGSQGPRVPGPCQRAARGSRQRSTLCHWGPPGRSPATAALGHRYGNVMECSPKILTYR